MTTLRFRRAIPVAIPDPLRPAWCEPDEAAAVGVIELRPHARQHETTGGHRVVLPALLTLALVAGEATVDVEPGHWQVRERIRAGAAQPWTVLVPDAVGIVDDCDLVIIDPATLTPTTPPTDAWLAALSAVAEGIPGAVADYLDANPPSAAPDATAATKGLLKLAGDLAGTADAPTVPGLAAHAADSTNVHGIADTGALVLDDDPRLIDARPPTAHGHNLDAVTDTATRLALTPAERTKLSGVATGATANASDAALRDRSTHTGTQPSASLADLTEAVQDIVAALIVAGTNMTVSYNDAAGTFTINASTGTVTDPEIVRDVIGAALTAGAGIQLTINDAGDSITITSTAVLPTRQVVAGTGLTGGGDLSANRTLSVSFGTTAGSVAEGNHTHTAASETVAGLVELATTAETTTGTDTTRAVTPAGVKAVSDLLVPKGLVDAKGDLLVGSAADTLIRLGVGTDGQALVADAASAGGVKWAAVSGGGGGGGGAAIGPRVQMPGRWVGSAFARSQGVGWGAEGVLGLAPWTFGGPISLAKLHVWSQTADASATVRVGLWAASTSTGKPAGSPLVALSFTGLGGDGVDYDLVISGGLTLPAGHYWAGAVIQGRTSGAIYRQFHPTMGDAGYLNPLGSPIGMGGWGAVAMYQHLEVSGVTGALPDLTSATFTGPYEVGPAVHGVMA